MDLKGLTALEFTMTASDCISLHMTTCVAFVAFAVFSATFAAAAVAQLTVGLTLTYTYSQSG